jgi:hypothetical protein
MVIGTYFICGYKCFLLVILLIVILLVAIGGYYINDYWKLLY